MKSVSPSAGSNDSARPILLAAVGDLLEATDPTGRRAPRGADRLFQAVRPLWADADVTVGNLEMALAAGGPRVDHEPRVIGPEAYVRGVAAAGFDVVSLANNHAFDALAGGFEALRSLLDELGVAHFGAGRNLAEARAPAVREVRGERVAFVGAVDARTGPSMLAGADSPGAAPLEIDALCRHVAVLAARYEHVIVMPHWGRERFTIPSPEQTRWARRLIEAGARAVLGHHPHVLQGIERIGPGLAAYSLGNFAASPVYWTDGDRMDWNRRERTAGVLRLELRREGVGDAKLLTTRDTGGQVVPDAGRRTRRLVRRLDGRLERGIGPRAFRIEAFGVQTLRPILQHLRPRALMRLRWRNVRNGLRMLLGRRGG